MFKMFAFSRHRFDTTAKAVALFERLASSPFPPTHFGDAEPIRKGLTPGDWAEPAEMLTGGPGGGGGSLFLRSGKPRSTFVFRWLDAGTAEWYGEFDEAVVRRAGGRDAVVEFFAGFFRAFPVVFAGLAPEADWDAKHWIVEEDDEGELVTKVGLDLRTGLPGVYWMTVFGADLVRFFGRDALSSAPLSELIDLGDAGVALLAGADPLADDRGERVAREDRVVRHLGRDFFFDIADPSRARRRIPDLEHGA